MDLTAVFQRRRFNCWEEEEEEAVTVSHTHTYSRWKISRLKTVLKKKIKKNYSRN